MIKVPHARPITNPLEWPLANSGNRAPSQRSIPPSRQRIPWRPVMQGTRAAVVPSLRVQFLVVQGGAFPFLARDNLPAYSDTFSVRCPRAGASGNKPIAEIEQRSAGLRHRTPWNGAPLIKQRQSGYPDPIGKGCGNRGRGSAKSLSAGHVAVYQIAEDRRNREFVCRDSQKPPRLPMGRGFATHAVPTLQPCKPSSRLASSGVYSRVPFFT